MRKKQAAWTDQDNQTLIQLYTNGTVIRVIADQLNTCTSQIHQHLRALFAAGTLVHRGIICSNLRRSHLPTGYRPGTFWTPERETRLIELVRQDWSLPLIAESMQISLGVIRTKYRNLLKLGVLSRRQSRHMAVNRRPNLSRSDIWTAARTRQLIALHKTGASHRSIAREMRLLPDQVGGKISRLIQRGLLARRPSVIKDRARQAAGKAQQHAAAQYQLPLSRPVTPPASLLFYF